MAEEGFPRGGKKKKQVKEDKGESKEKNSKNKAAQDKKEKFLKQDKKLELPSISYETLVEGTVCLGCVRKVLESSLLIGMAGMTVGSVDLRAVSTPYTEILEKVEKDELEDDDVVHPLESMFKVGDIVIVKVMNVVLNEGGKHRVTLSLNPLNIHSEWIATDLSENIVMTGAVKSKEDKGYIMDLGIKGVNAFLPMSSATVVEKKLRRPLGIGQLVSVNIVKCDIKRLMARVTLNSIPSKIKQVCAPEGQDVKLLPGMKVSCIVVDKRASGLMVSFLDSIIGRVHNDHLAEAHRADVSDTIIGRILFVPPWDVGPYITFDEVNCCPYSTESNPSFTQQVTGAARRRKGTVTDLEPRGAKIRLHGGGVALLKRQRASDKLEYTDEQFKKDFRARSEHDVRVIEYSPLDRLFIVSCEEHLLDSASIISKDEIQIGSIHQVQILSYNQGGAIVKLGDVKGFIPYLHFKDKVLSPQFVQKKFPVGAKISVKVFQINLPKNSVVCTAKKTLRISKGMVATSYSDIVVGSTGHGIVRFIAPNDKGIRIEMIGGLFGFVPKGKVLKGLDSEIPLVDRFPIGLPLEFKVLEVDAQKERAILTTDLNFEIPEQSSKSNQQQNERKRKVTDNANDNSSVVNKKKKKGKTILEKEKPSSIANSTEDEEIPILISINQSEKRKRKNSDKVSNVSLDLPKQQKLSNTSGNSIEPTKKLSKKEKQKLRRESKKEETQLTQNKESEDSGIENEAPVLKLPCKSFWDILPPSNLTSTEPNDSNDIKPEDVESSEEEIQEVNNDQDDAQEKKGNSKTDKKVKDKKVKTNIDESMTEKDHELYLIQNSSDANAWKSLKEFALRNGDPAKAVSIIKRIKDKIPFRDEKGKLYCWMAILQIETQYATESSTKASLEEALKANDPATILEKVAQFYESIGKIEAAEELYRRRLKLQQQEPNAWINLGLFLYRNEKIDAARALLPPALQQLSESNQTYVTAKFAKMEIEHGEVEKGRSMFLTICLQRPKRTDLWLLYANSLNKMKQFQLAGDALRSALSTKQLAPKECKPLLKRLMEIEKLHGTPESILKLKTEAAEFLNIDN